MTSSPDQKRKVNIETLLQARETEGNLPYQWCGTTFGRDSFYKEEMDCCCGGDSDCGDWKKKKMSFQRDETGPLWSLVFENGLPRVETLQSFQPSHRRWRASRNHHLPQLQMDQSK